MKFNFASPSRPNGCAPAHGEFGDPDALLIVAIGVTCRCGGEAPVAGMILLHGVTQ